ncbi:MAG: diguanylate cyclase [Betaproteobacteria bacterium]|nr:diguanylate cyclase [Betaproteobacteria bacterium]
MHMDTQTKRSILIVDDSPENLTVLGALLRTDYTIRVATDGEKALRIAQSGEPPDLILLDIMMPGVNGYEVCRRLKDDPRTESIPVIFLTAMTHERDEVKGFEAGAVDYITKPFSPVVVRARVRTHVELKCYRDFLVDTSYGDGLTAVPNRRRFEDYYAHIWKAPGQTAPVALIMIDVDHFKPFNDHYGHQEGDACLRAIAQELSGALNRKTDLFARYGGEEFVCLLPGTEAEGALQVAERFRAAVLALAIPHARSPVGDWVTISVGVAAAGSCAELSPRELVAHADEALYQAKAAGRNRVRLHDAEGARTGQGSGEDGAPLLTAASRDRP